MNDRSEVTRPPIISLYLYELDGTWAVSVQPDTAQRQELAVPGGGIVAAVQRAAAWCEARGYAISTGDLYLTARDVHEPVP